MTKRKEPYRPNSEITERYNDGIVAVYRITDGANPGYLPQKVREQRGLLSYRELRAGLQRYYAAMQSQIEVERVIRVPKPPFKLTTQDEAETEDGNIYGIGQIQTAEGIYPPSLDLTLTAIRQKDRAADAEDMA